MVVTKLCFRGFEMKYLSLTVLLFITIIALATTSSALEWHDCCNVQVNENTLQSLYHDFVQNNYCYKGSSYDDCLKDAIEDGRSFEEFKKILIDDSVASCKKRNEHPKDIFTNGLVEYSSFLGFDYNFDEIHDFSLPEYVSFYDPFTRRLTISPYSFDVKKTLWKEPREKGKTYSFFQADNSRFSYLKPKTPLSKVISKYRSEFYHAKEICDKIELTADNREDNYQMYQDCMRKNTHFTKNDIDLYYFYSGLKGSYYVDALAVCEEELGFQNDIGIISFPGQEKKSGCDEQSKIDGCCPGYHKDKEFDVCCSDGFKAYKSVGGSVLCGPSESELEVVSVDFDFDKKILKLDGKDKITAKLTYTARTPSGELIPYANKKVQSIVVDSRTNQFSFNVNKHSEKTDGNGVLTVDISLKKAQSDGMRFDKNNLPKVYVYSLDENYEDQNDDFFTLSFGDGIKIKSVDQLSGEAWQGSPVKLIVHVDDPMNEKKMYIFSSKTGFRVDGSSEDYVYFKTTNANDVDFAWFAPKISREMKMNYAKRIFDGLLKMSLVASEDLAGAKLNGRLAKLSKENVQLSTRFSKLNGFYDSTNKIVKTSIQANDAIKQGESLVKTAREPYQVAKKGISYLMWLEGTIGLLGKPATPLLTSLKVGLTGIDEWYSAVEDLEKIASSKKITLEFPVTVTVKGLQSGTNDTFTKNIPVKGFEMVLG